MEARRPLCAPADSSVGTERLRGRSRLLAGSDTLACLGASACASVRSPCTCPSALGPALPNKSWPLMCAVEPSIRARSTEGQNCSQCLQSLQMRAHALSVAEAFWGGLLDHKEGLEPFNLQLSPSSFFWSENGFPSIEFNLVASTDTSMLPLLCPIPWPTWNTVFTCLYFSSYNL